MSYYEKVLQPGETVKFVGKLHWIIYNGAIFFLILSAVLAFIITRIPSDGAGKYIIPQVIFAFSCVVFLNAWIKRLTTEIVVTNKRILHKTGIISRQTEEMNISKVETVDVNQGIWGRILNFGTVLVRGTGGSWEPMRKISKPLDFRNAILVD